MNPFKGRHFQRDIIPVAVRWYTKNTVPVTVSCRRCWLNAGGMSITHGFTAGFSVMRLKWKTYCAGTWRNSSDLLPVHMDETYVKAAMAAGRICPGRRQPGRTVVILSSSRRNSKASIPVLWQNPSTTRRSGRSRDSSTRIKRPPMVPRLFCSNAEGWCARLTLNTDGDYTGTT